MGRKLIDQKELLKKLLFVYKEEHNETDTLKREYTQCGLIEAMLVVVGMDTAETVERGDLTNDETTCV